MLVHENRSINSLSSLSHKREGLKKGLLTVFGGHFGHILTSIQKRTLLRFNKTVIKQGGKKGVMRARGGRVGIKIDPGRAFEKLKEALFGNLTTHEYSIAKIYIDSGIPLRYYAGSDSA